MKSIHIEAESLPEAFEEAIIRTWNEGSEIKTEYDKTGDSLSKDVTIMIHIEDPFKEPRIHRGFPGSLEDLEIYRSEVLYGCHDYFMDDKNNKERWKYTYHERLFNYRIVESVPDLEYGGLTGSFSPKEKRINQIQICIDKLKAVPYTRRAQAVTWQAWNDTKVDDPPCLQRLFFRILDNKLHMNAFFRSNCAFKASYFNIYALTELQKYVADQLGISTGCYTHYADSYHIYGSYFDEFKGFLNMVEKRSFEDRTYRTEDALTFFVDGCDSILKETGLPEDKRILVNQRKAYLEYSQK